MSADGSPLWLSGSYNSGGWIWRQSTGFVQLPDANYPKLGGISRDGSLVVGSLPNVGAFRFDTDSHAFIFPPINSPDTRALALSHDGTTALLSTSDGVFLWNGKSQTQIATLAAAGGSISNDGRVAAFVAQSGYAAYVWTRAGRIAHVDDLGIPPEPACQRQWLAGYCSRGQLTPALLADQS